MKLLFISTKLSSTEIPIGSAVVFKKFLARFSKEEVVILSIADYKNERAKWTSRFNYYSIPSFLFFPLIRKVFIKTFFRKLYFFFEWIIYPHLAIKKIKKIIQENSIDKIWVFTTPETIPILKKIHLELKIPYHLSIHDDMLETEFYFKDRYSCRLKPDLLFLLKRAVSCDFISEYMKEYYIKKYNCCNNAISVWGGFVEINSNIFEKIISKKIKKIVFFGSIGRIEEHRRFWEAISLINSSNTEDDCIYIDYFTHVFNIYKLPEDNKFVQFKGLKKHKDLLVELADYDAAYIPMSFDPQWKIVNLVSFPSKTMTCLEIGLPIIAHAPDYSTISKFVSKFGIGTIINSTKSEEIYKALVKFDKDYEYRKNNHKNLLNIRNHEFNIEENFNNLKKYLFIKG